jgi:hypothetical protein
MLAGAAIFLAAWACGKSPAARARDVGVCSDTADAGRIAACLRARGWAAAAADSAGTARAAELDALYTHQADSTWREDSTIHAADLARCTARPGDVASCLRLAGWPAARATATAESLWNADAIAHQRQIERCVAISARGNIADCLMLNYQWTPARALAANDSVQYAGLRR